MRITRTRVHEIQILSIRKKIRRMKRRSKKSRKVDGTETNNADQFISTSQIEHSYCKISSGQVTAEEPVMSKEKESAPCTAKREQNLINFDCEDLVDEEITEEGFFEEGLQEMDIVGDISIEGALEEKVNVRLNYMQWIGSLCDTKGDQDLNTIVLSTKEEASEAKIIGYSE